MALEMKPRPYALRSLRVDRYRHVRQGTSVTFDPDWNVFVGRNGGGKTTLLELVACAVSGNFTALLEESFDITFDLEMRGRAYHYRVSSEPVRLNGLQSFHAKVRLPDGTDVDLDGSGNVKHDGRERRPTRALVPRYLNGAVMGEAAEILGLRPLEVTIPHSHVRRLDEALETFARLVGRNGSLSDATIRVAHRDGAFAHSTHASEGPLSTLDLVAEFNAAAERLRGSQEIDLDGLPFVAECARLIGAKSGRLRLPFRDSARTGDTTEATYGPAAFTFVRHDGSVVHHDQLSFGQKRLLAFLHHIAGDAAVVVADEIVNGLHHEMIDAVLGAMEGRQRFLATQNPLLLDRLPLDGSESAQRRLVRCTTDRDELVWANLSGSEAGQLFDAYEAGIQHVGEILRSQGFW